MMKRKTWLTIGIAALLLFCTAVLAEGANRNVPLDSALDAALNAPGSGIAFANGSAYPWQVVEIDGGRRQRAATRARPIQAARFRHRSRLRKGRAFPLTGMLTVNLRPVRLQCGIILYSSLTANISIIFTALRKTLRSAGKPSHGLRMRRELIPWSGHITRMHRTIPVRTAVILTTLL